MEQNNWPPQNSAVINTQPIPNPQYAPVQQTQPQHITREQYEAEKAQTPQGFTALTNEDIPF